MITVNGEKVRKHPPRPPKKSSIRGRPPKILEAIVMVQEAKVDTAKVVELTESQPEDQIADMIEEVAAKSTAMKARTPVSEQSDHHDAILAKKRSKRRA